MKSNLNLVIFVQDHASSDGTQFSNVSQSADDAESSSKARLDVMISTACEEPSARDALFGLFIRSGYGLLPTRLRLSNSNLPHPLLDAVDDLIRALKTFQHPEFIQETLQLCVVVQPHTRSVEPGNI